MNVKTIIIYVIAVCMAFISAHTTYSAENIVPSISSLLFKPDIYKCQARLLADLNGPGNTPYATRARFTDLGNLTLFFADHPDTGTELWVTDGTPGGTHIVKDILPGQEGSVFTAGWDKKIIRVGDKVYFLADDGVHGEELWITDGTTSGTHMVRDINVGENSSSWIKDLTEFNGKLYFMVGNTGKPLFEGQGLWVSEGTESTTKVVASPPIVGTWSAEQPDTMIVYNNQLFFVASGNSKGYELWKSDGTGAGTSLVKDINPGQANTKIWQFTVVGNKLYFMADQDQYGREVWVSDGTGSGTHMVKDIYPGTESGAVMINIDWAMKKNPGFNNKLYFLGRTPAEGTELWVTDGTENGTKLVRDIVPGPESPFFGDDQLLSFNTGEVFNGKFYFSSSHQSNSESPYEEEALWRVNEDGSATIERFIGIGGVEFLTANDDFLFFRTALAKGPDRELGIMDKSGRTRILDIYPGRSQSSPGYLHIRNDQSLLFVTSSPNYAPGVGLYQVECPVEAEP